MKAFFKELFDYTYHYNNEVITSLLKSSDDNTHEKSILLLNHTINAHEIWNTRIINKKPFTGIWEMRSIEQLQEQNKANYECTIQIVEAYNLTDVIQYTNSKGLAFENSVKDILFHVVNHSTYHRGQIATYFKQGGGTPVVSDYIYHKRQVL